MKPILVIDTKTYTPRMPEVMTGVIGQVSLPRLINILRRVGEIGKLEEVTHVSFFSDGTIQYRIDRGEKP